MALHTITCLLLGGLTALLLTATITWDRNPEDAHLYWGMGAAILLLTAGFSVTSWIWLTVGFAAMYAYRGFITGGKTRLPPRQGRKRRMPSVDQEPLPPL